MFEEYLPEIFIAAILVIMIGSLVYFISKGGFMSKSGSMTSAVLGANDSLYNKEKQTAVQVMLEQKEQKKMEEQSTGEPKH